MKSLQRVLVANRGEIAVRCIRACKELSITSVAIFTRADSHSLHVRSADVSVLLENEGSQAYMDIDDILKICADQSIDAVIPGYGFLSEDAEFCRRVEEAGMVFVGPDANTIKCMGLKHIARDFAIAAQVPVIEGTGLLENASAALREARVVGFPVCKTCPLSITPGFETDLNFTKVIIKASGGGGGIGQRICYSANDIIGAFADVDSRSKALFKDAGVFLESYRSAGTVEFLVDHESDSFCFLEMNTRLQVEHGITELCHGVDIVTLMLRQAQCQVQGLEGIPVAELLALQEKGSHPQGVAIEVRLSWPELEGLRIDTWIQTGTVVSPYFDSLLGKVMVHRNTREEVIEVLQAVLKRPMIGGITTNQAFLASIIASPLGLSVLKPGAMTTIQQPRPRDMKGYGVPQSGPMDDLSATIANLLVGNPRDTECLEVVLSGPELRFHSSAIIAIAGAPFPVTVNGVAVDMWSRLKLQRGDNLEIGKCAAGTGARCYLAIKGGFPTVLGLGGFQGRPLQARDFLDLATQDEKDSRVALSHCKIPQSLVSKLLSSFQTIYVMHGPHDSDDFITAAGRRTIYNSSWKVDHNCSRTGIRLIGPKIEWSREDGGPAGGAHPSNVLDYPYPSPGGVNWTGDSPVIFPCDAPGFGGFICSSTVPSAELWKLGQLSPGAQVTLVPISYQAARKLADDKECLVRSIEDFIVYLEHEGNSLPTKDSIDPPELADIDTSDAILEVMPKGSPNPAVTLRQGGDSFIIIELAFDEVGLRAAVKTRMLAQALREVATPHTFIHVNLSSITVEYDPRHIEQSSVVELISTAWTSTQAAAGAASDNQQTKPLSHRRLRLPIVFDHPSIQEAHERYAALQRDKAAYMPDNVAYLRENNGLSSRAAVFRRLRDTPLLVVAVGFMTGLPLLLPLDPLCRLVAQKYNPPRVSTPPGTVGLGGALFCIYPAQQPGGYMMVARTLPVWDTHMRRPGFAARGTPWLCEPFDLVEFQEVGVEAFDEALEAFETGTYCVDIETIGSSDSSSNSAIFPDVSEALAREAERSREPEILEFRRRQSEAAEKTRLREQVLFQEWTEDQARATEPASAGTEAEADASGDDGVASGGGVRVTSSQAGKLWKVQVEVGERVKDGQTLAVLEAMKMEIAVLATAEHDGMSVKAIVLREGALVAPGSLIMVLEP
ncbi:hypothetical protein SLS62_006516 [Diatrype stigma]|uniref:Urea carboxylase n=1 Tax=Diatrype stigma TaxID=117547 RepID=A0AAN9YP18_9PEZI